MIIAIDPDLEKSGFAKLENGKLELFNFTFFELQDYFKDYRYQIEIIIIEAGWLNKKSNWHGAANKSIASRIGKNVGENHATGKLLAQMCEHMGLPYVLVKPTRTKLNAEEFKLLTGYEGRTNQETRDAGCLAFAKK